MNKPWLKALCFLLLPCSAAVFAQTKAPPVASSPMVIAQVLIGLAVVTALIFVFAWLAKRIGYGGFIPQKDMRVLGYLMVGQREKAVLVQVGEKQMLLGVAPGRVSLLHAFDEPAVEDENAQDAATGQANKVSDFSRYLKEILKSGPSR